MSVQPPVVVQLNVSAGGVPKHPIDNGSVTSLGIAGDKHLYRLHGGPRKALLLMASEVIDALSAGGFSVDYGALGENVTTRWFDHTSWRTGQRYRIGKILVELTEPRVPCSKLNPFGLGIQERIFDAKVRAGNTSSPRWGMSGFYAAVLEEGFVRKGDVIHPE